MMMEIYIGDLLFQTHSNYEHIALIEKIIKKIPNHMKEKCRESEIKNHFIKGEYDFMKYGPIK